MSYNITSTETIPPIHNVPALTPIINKITLICEERESGKRCLFKDLKINVLPNQTFEVLELIEKNVSLQYFLKNCMVF